MFIGGGKIFATQATFYAHNVSQPSCTLAPKPQGGEVGGILGQLIRYALRGCKWRQNFQVHAHERFILRCGRHNATLRVRAHWVSSTLDSTQCNTGSVDGRRIPRLPYHNTDLYYTCLAPFLNHFLLRTLCHTTILLPLQFYTVVTSTELRHQT